MVRMRVPQGLGVRVRNFLCQQGENSIHFANVFVVVDLYRLYCFISDGNLCFEVIHLLGLEKR